MRPSSCPHRQSTSFHRKGHYLVRILKAYRRRYLRNTCGKSDVHLLNESYAAATSSYWRKENYRYVAHFLSQPYPEANFTRFAEMDAKLNAIRGASRDVLHPRLRELLGLTGPEEMVFP